MAGDPTPSYRNGAGTLARTARLSEGAAGVERASRGWVDRARHLALERLPSLPSRADIGDRIEQHARVGMLGALEHVLRCAPLDQAAEIHDPDTIGHVRNH